MRPTYDAYEIIPMDERGFCGGADKVIEANQRQGTGDLTDQQRKPKTEQRVHQIGWWALHFLNTELLKEMASALFSLSSHKHI